MRTSIFAILAVSFSLYIALGIESAYAKAISEDLSFNAEEDFNPDNLKFLSESEASEQRATLQELAADEDVRPIDVNLRATDFSSRGRTHHYHYRHGGGGCIANQGTPVWGTFETALSSCAPGCTTGGDTCAHSHRGRSCHNSGRAVDVGSIICGGQRFGASTGRFHAFVACARKFFPPTMEYLRKRHKDNVLWQQANHYDHAHFSLGCPERGI